MHERSSKHETHATRWADWFLESFVGQCIYYATRSKTHWYPEEKPGFRAPEKYYKTKGQKLDEKKQQNQSKQNDTDNSDARSESTAVGEQQQSHQGEKAKKKNSDPESGESNPQDNQEEQNQKEEDPNLVTWYDEKDIANPQNWSLFKKCIVTAQICLLTFSIYIGSAIFSPGYVTLTEEFGISQVAATLGLTLFVIGYGVGPLFLAPLSEIPAIGRNYPYLATLLIFVVLQPISATVQNFGGLLVLRFLAGFIGSPVLATGGASIGDMFSTKTRPYAIGIWGLAAVTGPVLGPLLGGFAIQANDWRWAFWVLLWLDSLCLGLLVFCLPETSSNNILLRRAKRLRKATGNENLRSQGEIDQANMTGKQVAKMTLLLPIWLSISEPICFFLNLYIGLVYSILYIWIECFFLVFEQMHGFNLGENGLAYMGLFVGAVITYIGFCVWNAKSQIPTIRKYDGKMPPEKRLVPAMFGSFFLPLCLFSFGATSNPSIHWIVPIICSSFFSVGTFLLFQAVLNYLQDAYPERAASVLAGNDFVRSMMGAAFPLFAVAMFNNLGGPHQFGIFWGCVLLGCLSILFIPIPFVLYKYGKQLRLRSPNARHDL